MELGVTILGCGSSGGVPRPGAGWGACDPTEPRNRRRRCSLMVERLGAAGRTSLIVDTSPDLREQLLDAQVTALDAVLFSHDHADHTHGIDDVRPLVLHMRRRLPAYADARTRATLMARFGYIFETPAGSMYPPIMTLNPLEAGEAFAVEGAGGTIPVEPFSVEHGAGYEALGFRFGGLGYLPDVSRIPAAARERLRGLDLLILDCLRQTPHPTHFSLAESLAAIAELAPRRAILTDLHSDLDYAEWAGRLPPHVAMAFDGMQLSAAL